MNTEDFDYITEINDFTDNTYVTDQLRQHLNINIRDDIAGNDNFMKVIREMYNSHEGYRRRNLILEKKTEDMQEKLEEREKMIGKLLNEKNLEREDRNSREKSLRDTINDLKIELSKAEGKERGNCNEIKRLKSDIQSLKTSENKSANADNKMEIIGKGFYKKEMNLVSETNDFYTSKLHESQQVAMKDIQAQIDQRNSSLIQILTQIIVFCKPRRDYIMNNINQIRGKESISSMKELDDLLSINLDSLDVSKVDQVDNMIKKCISFLDSFDAFLDENFKNFLQNRVENGLTKFDFEKAFINVSSKEQMTTVVETLRDINKEQEKTMQNQNDLMRINPRRNNQTELQQLIERCKMKTSELKNFIHKHNISTEEHTAQMRQQDMKIEEAHKQVNDVMELYNSSNRQTN